MRRACPDTPLNRPSSEPFSDAELDAAEYDLVEQLLGDPEVRQGDVLPLIELVYEAASAEQGAVPSIDDEVIEAAEGGRVNFGRMVALSTEERAEALRQPEVKCKHDDALWTVKHLERLATRNEAGQTVRWENGRRCQSPTEFAAARLPAARKEWRRAAVALASRRRSTCTEGPARRTRARRRGAGSPAHRRKARANAPPGGEASEAEPAKRPAPADDDVVLAAVLA